MSLSARIGQYFFFLGLIALIIFIGTAQVDRPAYGFCCGGLVILLFGLFLLWRGRTPPKPSGRFRLLRGKGEEDSENDGPGRGG
jgi:hypothetical protein